jgi:hypothetical protein
VSDRRTTAVGANAEYAGAADVRRVSGFGIETEHVLSVNQRQVSGFGIETEHVPGVNPARVGAFGICVEYRPSKRRRRMSGKRAMIQLQRGTDPRFDVSGVSSDGAGRANKFSFTIEPAGMIEISGFNDAWKQEIPEGSSAWSADLTVFYNADAGEVNEYLIQMYREQHDPAACADPQRYTLYIAPEGRCGDLEEWTGRRCVIRSLNVRVSPGGVMVIDVKLSGWRMVRGRVVA